MSHCKFKKRKKQKVVKGVEKAGFLPLFHSAE